MKYIDPDGHESKESRCDYYGSCPQYANHSYVASTIDYWEGGAAATVGVQEGSIHTFATAMGQMVRSLGETDGLALASWAAGIRNYQSATYHSAWQGDHSQAWAEAKQLSTLSAMSKMQEVGGPIGAPNFVSPAGNQAQAAIQGQQSRIRFATVYGTAQKTNGANGLKHADDSMRIVEQMARTGNYREFHLNRELKSITGGRVQSALRPDVAGIRWDGAIDLVEITSPSQTLTSQLQKARYMAAQLAQAGIRSTGAAR